MLLASPIRFPLGGRCPASAILPGSLPWKNARSRPGSGSSAAPAIEQVAVILAAKGGAVADVTVATAWSC